MQLSLFSPKESFLHRRNVVTRMIWLLFYTVILFTSDSMVIVGTLLALAITLTLVWRTPLRNPMFVLVTSVLFIASMLNPSGITARIIVALAKIVALMLMATQISLSTRPSEILSILQHIPGQVQKPVYLLNSTFVALPVLNYELRRAIDAEWIRRGRRVRLYRIGAWQNILTILFIRAMSRARRQAESITARGFTLDSNFTTLTSQPSLASEIVWLVIGFLPGIGLLVVAQ